MPASESRSTGRISPIANTHLHAFLVSRYWSRRVSRSDAMRTAEPRHERFPSVGAFRRPRLADLRRRCTRMHGRVASCVAVMLASLPATSLHPCPCRPRALLQDGHVEVRRQSLGVLNTVPHVGREGTADSHMHIKVARLPGRRASQGDQRSA